MWIQCNITLKVWLSFAAPDISTTRTAVNNLYCYTNTQLLQHKYSPSDNINKTTQKKTNIRVLIGKPEGKRPLGRPRRRWVDNIRMDLQEVGCGYMDWIGLAQDRDSGGRL